MPQEPYRSAQLIIALKKQGQYTLKSQANAKFLGG